jgi:hypothetical protein
MSGRDTSRIIGTWLNDLAAMTAGQTPLADAKAKIATIAEVLLCDFPDQRCYSKQSLYAAAREFKWFPTYAELSSFMAKWWEANRPRHTALPRIEDPSLSLEDRGHVNSWLNLKAEWQAAGRLAVGLSTLRSKPRAFAYICRTDTDAAAIAVRHRWPVDEHTAEHTEAEKAHASATAEAAIGAIRGGANLATAIDRAVSAQSAAFKAAQQERTAADLARQREASPAVQKARAYQAAMNPKPANDPAPPDGPVIDGEVIPPATASGAAWRAPWED